MTNPTALAGLDGTTSADGILDFTDPMPPARFRIGDDVFEVVPGLPALSFMEFSDLAGQQIEEPGEARDMFQRMFRLVLVEDSAERFIARLEDRHRPITIMQVQKVIPFVMEQLGLRPTEPSEPSSNGSDGQASGPNSTESAPLPESDSAVYPFPTSSTTSTGS
jgi:hypothetical protein